MTTSVHPQSVILRSVAVEAVDVAAVEVVEEEAAEVALALYQEELPLLSLFRPFLEVVVVEVDIASRSPTMLASRHSTTESMLSNTTSGTLLHCKERHLKSCLTNL
jgi:hypothetical protein